MESGNLKVGGMTADDVKKAVSLQKVLEESGVSEEDISKNAQSN